MMSSSLRHLINLQRTAVVRALLVVLITLQLNYLFGKTSALQEIKNKGKIFSPGGPPPIKNVTIPEIKHCALGTADSYISRWLNANGSLYQSEAMLRENKSYLDLSNQKNTPESLYALIRQMYPKYSPMPRVLTVANSDLRSIPIEALNYINGSLELLSMHGNVFKHKFTQFPYLGHLMELDMRNCCLTELSPVLFDRAPTLRTLYLAHNQFKEIGANVFLHASNLMHLDLSFNNFTVESNPNIDTENLSINKQSFRGLNQILFLDLSYTRLQMSSVRAMAPLPETLSMLSMCYTKLVSLPGNMFNGSTLRVLDISGNPMLPGNLQWNTFIELSNTLTAIIFKNSGITNMNSFCELFKLRFLILSYNNINTFTKKSFDGLNYLRVIDLSHNEVRNWYTPVFDNMQYLRILNLHDNHLNVISSAMFRDFENLDFISLGNNKFVCTCNLANLIDVAAMNNRPANISVPRISPSNITGWKPSRSELYQNLTNFYQVIFFQLIGYDDITASYRNMVEMKKSHMRYNVLMLPPCNGYCNDIWSSFEFRQNRMIADELFVFRYRLADYAQDRYSCINSSSGSMSRFQDMNCTSFDKRNLKDTDLNRVTIKMAISMISIMFAMLLVYLLVYKYRWYIRFFLISLRNAVVLGLVNKDHRMELIRKHSQTTADGDSLMMDFDDESYNYDVFVSYSELNRDWILSEFLINMDQCQDIKVCLHERDFQIGVSILENIIECMDQSRCLVLVISESFVMSKWCQFEMNLAQHRLLESRRDQLILIMLEDVPKRKRPKTLHYLMRTKTYIKWPQSSEYESEAELQRERRLFWQRLKRALKEHEWDEDRNGDLYNTSAA